LQRLLRWECREIRCIVLVVLSRRGRLGTLPFRLRFLQAAVACDASGVRHARSPRRVAQTRSLGPAPVIVSKAAHDDLSQDSVQQNADEGGDRPRLEFVVVKPALTHAGSGHTSLSLIARSSLATLWAPRATSGTGSHQA